MSDLERLVREYYSERFINLLIKRGERVVGKENTLEKYLEVIEEYTVEAAREREKIFDLLNTMQSMLKQEFGISKQEVREVMEKWLDQDGDLKKLTIEEVLATIEYEVDMERKVN